MNLSACVLLPEKKAPVVTLLQALLRATQAPGCALDRAFPIPVGKGRLPLRMSGPEAKTAVMGILNFTPDSFSDGGQHNASAVAAVGRMKLLEAHGADILDVGGQSTRPNAELVGGDEEMARVVPVFEVRWRARLHGCVEESVRESERMEGLSEASESG
eukprot:2943423-Rhodomonas_salina.2